MVTKSISVSVFISSPSELIEERQIAVDICSELTQLRSGFDGARVEPITWETHVRPTAGEYPQGSINQQVGDKYDIFLGFLGNRFGTETKKAGSGTEEEFDRAHNRWQDKENIEMLFYFRDPKTAPGALSASQLMKVEEFKGKLNGNGFLFRSYNSPDEFRSLLLQHLNTAIDAVLKKDGAREPTAPSQKKDPEANRACDPLANLNAVSEEDEEEGYLELADIAEQEFGSLVSVTNTITKDVEIVAEEFTNSTNRIKAITASGGEVERGHAKTIINSTASKMERYIESVASKLPAINTHFSKGIDAAGRIVLLAKLEHDYTEETSEQFGAMFLGFSENIPSVTSNITEFNSTIKGFPRTTTKMNRAKKRMIAINDDLIVFFNSAGRQVQNLFDEL